MDHKIWPCPPQLQEVITLYYPSVRQPPGGTCCKADLPANPTDREDQGDENYYRGHEPFLNFIHPSSFLNKAGWWFRDTNNLKKPFSKLLKE
jgi:hypothetical protein